MRAARRLMGTVNLPLDEPGFASPVFSDGCSRYVQVIDDTWRIEAFCETSIDEKYITESAQGISRDVGDSALCAFHFSPVEVLVGTREEMVALLRDRWVEFQYSPFLLLEIADFIGDEQLESMAISAASMEVRQMNPDAELRVDMIPQGKALSITLGGRPADEADRSGIEKESEYPEPLRERIAETVNLFATLPRTELRAKHKLADLFERVLLGVQTPQEFDRVLSEIVNRHGNEAGALFEVAVSMLDNSDDYWIWAPSPPVPPRSTGVGVALFVGNGVDLKTSNEVMVRAVQRFQEGEEYWLSRKWPSGLQEAGMLVRELARWMKE